MIELDYIPMAIDPGSNGAIALFDALCPSQPIWHKIPETLIDLFTSIEIAKNYDTSKPVRAFLEYNTGFMAGIKSSSNAGGEMESSGVSPKAMYSFGRSTGHIEMALVAAGIPICRVTPIKWQNAAGVTTARKRLMTPGQWKNHLKEEAKKRWPGVHITLANADAFLILDTAIKGRIKHHANLF